MVRTGRDSALTGVNARFSTSSPWTLSSCTDLDLRDRCFGGHDGLGSVATETAAGFVEVKLLLDSEALLGALEDSANDDGLGAVAVGRRRYLARL